MRRGYRIAVQLPFSSADQKTRFVSLKNVDFPQITRVRGLKGSAVFSPVKLAKGLFICFYVAKDENEENARIFLAWGGNSVKYAR